MSRWRHSTEPVIDTVSFVPKFHLKESDMSRDLFNRTPILSGNDPDTVRRVIGNYFHATFDRYEKLFETLSCDESYYKKPITLRHPLIFYLGHTATFFINKLTLEYSQN